MNTPHALSPLYLLERFEPGVISLDRDRRVVGMNDFARRLLPVEEKQPFNRFVLDFHPERSQPKVSFMLDQAAQCPVSNPPPMTMIINIPERVLLIKVTRLTDGARQTAGYTLVFYDITDVVAAKDASALVVADGRRQLAKIPTTVQQRIVLVETDDVLAIQSEGHYTQIQTEEGCSFCNLSIGDLASRLDPTRFLRVHRSHIVNLTRVSQLRRVDGRLFLDLAPQLSVPVSRSSAQVVLDKLGIRA